jgi:hypothetical protein
MFYKTFIQIQEVKAEIGLELQTEEKCKRKDEKKVTMK